jgi:NAD-binding of NADP-dependent 3-hydroxyisobutyrate dehydrogenase
LAIMIGGDDRAAIARAKPVLQSMGERLFETGSLASGHATKALNNFMAAAGFVAAAEALLIGKRFGLDQTVMMDIINASTGRNFNTEVVIKEHVIGGKHATGFALGLLAKDVRIAADLGEAVHLDAPLTRLIRERYALACERLGSARDNTEAILAGKMSGKGCRGYKGSAPRCGASAYLSLTSSAVSSAPSRASSTASSTLFSVDSSPPRLIVSTASSTSSPACSTGPLSSHAASKPRLAAAISTVSGVLRFIGILPFMMNRYLAW